LPQFLNALEQTMTIRGTLIASLSLFIALSGRPCTPVSFAGINRRPWRRGALD
jgi:hypothetical protein